MSSDSNWNNKPGWFKSSFSGGADNCLEVNLAGGPTVGIRDSKDEGTGLVLTMSRLSYADFIDAARTGKLAR